MGCEAGWGAPDLLAPLLRQHFTPVFAFIVLSLIKLLANLQGL